MIKSSLASALALLLAIALCTAIAVAQGVPTPSADAVRFATVAIEIDSGDAPLAAYQLEFRAAAGHARIVGIEGGDHPAFREPPYYDPRAMQHERAILAAFNTAAAADLPRGRTRVATVHLELTGLGDPALTTELVVASDPEGRSMPATITIRGAQR